MSAQPLADSLDYFSTFFTVTLGCVLLQSGILAESSFAEVEAPREANSTEAIETIGQSQGEHEELEVLPYSDVYAETETQLAADSFNTISDQFPLWLSFQTGPFKLITCKF
jgi:hypothetical protein